MLYTHPQSLRDGLLHDIITNLSLTQRLAHSHFQKTSNKLGLTVAQWQLLFTVSCLRSASIKQLAETMCLTPGAISQLVEPLVRQRLLERIADDRDRRVGHLSLSRGGLKKVATGKKQRERFFKSILEELDDTELQAFLQVQRKIITRLENKA